MNYIDFRGLGVSTSSDTSGASSLTGRILHSPSAREKKTNKNNTKVS